MRNLRHRAIELLLFIALCCISACDAHDYWLMTDEIEVNSEENILTSTNTIPIKQDLFVRYQLDYEIENQSETQPTEVVVSATSYVNSIARATGQKVWHLEPQKAGSGILSTSQLQLGNSLVVSLSCCAPSRCSSKDVICPEDPASVDVNEVAEFCYNSCEDRQACISNCPSEEACTSYCSDVQDKEECRKMSCGYGGNVSTCAHDCEDDSTCLETCSATSECSETCTTKSESCFMNCLAVWNQCSEVIYEPNNEVIPCALCGGEGLCKLNLDVTEKENLSIESESGESYSCDLNCSSYPTACYDGCMNEYESTTERLPCLTMCLRQHLFWCNDYSIPYDYVSDQGTQPCCFEDYCQGSLHGVVKTYDVECFNDTSCSSGTSCSAEGICVSNGSSNCSASTRSKSPFILWILGLPIIALHRRRKDRVHA